MLIDTCCMQLVQNPQQFDVLLMTNLYGTVITNAVIGISNGAGLLSSRNYGQHVRSNLFVELKLILQEMFCILVCII